VVVWSIFLRPAYRKVPFLFQSWQGRYKATYSTRKIKSSSICNEKCSGIIFFYFAYNYSLLHSYDLKFQDLIKKLLRRPVSRRLGTNEGAIEIKSHNFFCDVDWDDVYNKALTPPFIPQVKNSEDVSNFDSRFTGTPVTRESADDSLVTTTGACRNPVEVDDEKENEPLKDANGCDPFNNMFADFDYVSPEMYASEIEGQLSTSLQEMKIRTHGSP